MPHQEPDVHAIFNDAIERESGEERSKYLDEVCQNAPLIRERVEALLRAHVDPRNVLGALSPIDAATIEQVAAERPGANIGRYMLLEELGEGGMAVVYKAEQTEPVHRVVALKILKPGMDTRRVIARFEAERQALALMDHPSIAKVFDAGTAESGRPYFVMELVDGTPLTDYCDHHQLTTRQRLELFVQVCLAVQHAHQKGITHRDLKPSNILVTLCDGRPVPKIIDFGIAKAIHRPPGEAALTTGLGLIMGTPLYMSPEQAGTSGLNVDTRSDIYALGVIVYELLTGSTPFNQERVKEASYDEIRRIIREEEPPRPSARISTLGDAAAATVSTCRSTEPARLSRLLRGDLDWIVMKALEKDPAHRYQTAADLAQDIQRHLASEPIEARPPSLLDHAAKWSRRHRPLVWSAVVFLALSMIGLSISTLLIANAYNEKNQQLTATEKAEKLAKEQEGLAKQQEGLAKEQERLAKQQEIETQKQRDVARRNLYLAQMRLAHQDLFAGQVARLHDMLDSYVPQPGQVDLRGWEWYYLLSQCHGELLTELRANSVNAIAWSPDGSRIASNADDNRAIEIWDPVTGKEVQTFRGHNGEVHSLAWSPDGSEIGSASDDSIRFWNANTGGLLRSLIGRTGPISCASWSRDLRSLTAVTADGAIRVFRTDTGEAMRVLKPSGLTADQRVSALSLGPDGRQLASAIGCMITIWNVSKGEAVRTLCQGGVCHGVCHIAWSPDGGRLSYWKHGELRGQSLGGRHGAGD